jgi:hypothetical protein
MMNIDEKNIIESDPNKFPYGAKITIFLNGTIQFDLQQKIHDFGDNLTIKFIENKTTASEYLEVTFPGSQVWDILLVGFSNACDAEQAGLKLAQSFLWLSISRDFPIRLLFNKPLPCTVYDRTIGPSFEVSMFGHQAMKETPETIMIGVKEAFYSTHVPEIDMERILLAMEIYSSSQLEVTQRAKFISLITALEALSAQQSYKPYSDLVREKVDDLIIAIQNEKGIPERVRKSLSDRIKREMNIESVRQAILKVVMHFLQEKENKKLFEKAYDIRSSLLHDGKTDNNLDEITQSTSQMIRKIMSSCLNLKLSRG